MVESEQVDFATVYNDLATADQSGALTATTLTGLGMGATVTYGSLETLDMFLGSGRDTFTVSGTVKRADGFRTVTMLNTGAGDDNVTVTLNALTDGFFALNTEAGNDQVNASTSSLPLVLFGGEGNDSIQGRLGRRHHLRRQGPRGLSRRRRDPRHAPGARIGRAECARARRH